MVLSHATGVQIPVGVPEKTVPSIVGQSFFVLAAL
jgi:hypothetical protein